MSFTSGQIPLRGVRLARSSHRQIDHDKVTMLVKSLTSGQTHSHIPIRSYYGCKDIACEIKNKFYSGGPVGYRRDLKFDSTKYCPGFEPFGSFDFRDIKCVSKQV